VPVVEDMISKDIFMEKHTFIFDVSRCSGCMACIVACLDQNDHKSDGLPFRRVLRQESDRKGQPEKISYYSLSCLHCSTPSCVENCPTEALYVIDSIVLYDTTLCVGCRNCEAACAFGVPQYNSDGKMVKCDFCNTRLTHGMDPACVKSCGTGALTFASCEDQQREKLEDATLSILKSMSVYSRN
jgi:anaerobic dimethyl sulfoxide reductase subunit B (iron-sulfur subunit)